MSYLKKVGISLIYIIGIILVSTFLITILNYFNIISGTFLTITKILICVTSMFVGGFIMGRRSSNKGWLEGIKLSLIFMVLLILFNYLGLGISPKIKNLLYYSIIIVSCILGSIIGINKKHSNTWGVVFYIIRDII